MGLDTPSNSEESRVPLRTNRRDNSWEKDIIYSSISCIFGSTKHNSRWHSNLKRIILKRTEHYATDLTHKKRSVIKKHSAQLWSLVYNMYEAEDFRVNLLKSLHESTKKNPPRVFCRTVLQF